jgi:hypothetical protein
MKFIYWCAAVVWKWLTRCPWCGENECSKPACREMDAEAQIFSM